MNLQNLDENVINILYGYLRGKEAARFLQTGRFAQAGPSRSVIEEAKSIKEVFTQLTNALRAELDQPNPDFTTILDLIESGVNPNTKSRLSNTPLLVALYDINQTRPRINSSALKLVKRLLYHDANIYLQDQGGYDALDYAIMAQNPELIIEFLQRGADLNQTHIVEGVLCEPVYIENFEFVKFLFEQGLDVSNINKPCGGLSYQEQTPFLIAVYKGNLEIVKYLLQLGANIQRDGAEALSLAARQSNFEMIQYLIENGADIRGLEGNQVICDLAFEGNIEFLKFLIQKGINKTELLNPCSIYRYVSLGNGEFQGITRDYNENGDLTPFLISILRGHLNIAKLLLDNGADVNDVDDNSRSALILAVIEDDLNGVKWLIEHGADLEIEDDQEGWTALTYAQELGHRRIERVLREAGAEEQ